LTKRSDAPDESFRSASVSYCYKEKTGFKLKDFREEIERIFLELDRLEKTIENSSILSEGEDQFRKIRRTIPRSDKHIVEAQYELTLKQIPRAEACPSDAAREKNSLVAEVEEVKVRRTASGEESDAHLHADNLSKAK